LQHVSDLGRPQSRVKGRHYASPVGDDPPDLRSAFSLYGVTKIGRSDRQAGSQRAIASPAASMAIDAPLSVKRVHALITATAKKQGEKKNRLPEKDSVHRTYT
jgi:hypothetical protein